MFQASRALEPVFQEQSRTWFWDALTSNYVVDEAAYLKELIALADSDTAEQRAITERATGLISRVRARTDTVHTIDALLQQYSLDTEEGVLLMCLAEALMRIPDKATADAFIEDKLSMADWQRYVGRSESTLVNASTWGLLLTGRVIRMDRRLDGSPSGIWKRLIKRSGEPVIRSALYRAMGILGEQFVLGPTIGEAIENGRSLCRRGFTYSFDMLGEAALTRDDAEGYFDQYLNAIDIVGADPHCGRTVPRPSVSVKLSALHPRFDSTQESRVLEELGETLRRLVARGRERNVAITLDAEDMDSLELALKLFEQVYDDDICRGWSGFGLAVQAYSKRALPALCWLNRLARDQGDEIPVRLVKGAYWDSEIKRSQQLGLEEYPVFTRKEGTDTSFQACLRYLFSDHTRGRLYPQLASHNAQTVASVLVLARDRRRPFELQRLHGMGEPLYEQVRDGEDVPVRIYAPVGAHKELLPYLMRRLLENGANSSFVHRLVDAATPVEALVRHPVWELQKYPSLRNDRIPRPVDLYGAERRNAAGLNLRVDVQRSALLRAQHAWREASWQASPVIEGRPRAGGGQRAVHAPQDEKRIVGTVNLAEPGDVMAALHAASDAFPAWSRRPVAERAAYVEALADRLEAHRDELVALCGLEAGKALPESVEEVRKAVDYCRYYAAQGRARLSSPIALPGPTGETNELTLSGRGVFACFSPAHPPLSVLIGQITAALVAGNTVLVRPALQASLTAFRACELMRDAGVPDEVVHLLPGEGDSIDGNLFLDPRLAGIAFTGFNDEAQAINLALAQRQGPIIPLLARTGGWNAMVADSSALPEQVVRDAVAGAFTSAGQRQSSLRVLYVQADVADRVETMLAGAIRELTVGDPLAPATDVGPLVDGRRCAQVRAAVDRLDHNARCIARAPLHSGQQSGYFVAPAAYAVADGMPLVDAGPGPILQVVRYPGNRLEQLIERIHQAPRVQTLSIHTRSEATASYIEQSVRVGNCYINRHQIGAVAGVQPFGCGAGAKSGGPHYLQGFVQERARTVNTTAMGGNASLLSLGVERIQSDAAFHGV